MVPSTPPHLYTNVTSPLALDTFPLLEVSALSIVDLPRLNKSILDYSGTKTGFRMDIVLSCASFLCVVSAPFFFILPHNSLAWICFEVDSPIAGLSYILSRVEHSIFTFTCVLFIISAVSRIVIPCVTSHTFGFLPPKPFKSVSLIK